jgi:hypothetical protein
MGPSTTITTAIGTMIMMAIGTAGIITDID